MNETTTQATEKTVKRVRAKRSSAVCDCPTQQPQPKEFELPGMKGICCAECLHVLSWQLADVPGRHIPFPETTPAQEQVPAAPEQNDFLVAYVLAVKGDNAKIKLRLKDDSLFFDLVMQSTPEKVANMLNGKVILIGKNATIEFNGRDGQGRVMNPRFIKMVKQS